MSVEVDIPGLYITTAVKDVVRIMAGLELNEIKTVSENNEAVSEEITGLLIMVGESNVLLTLGISRESAATLVVYMTGIAKPQLSAFELNDCVAELTNMIAGQLKTQLGSLGQHYKNLPPIVVTGSNYEIIHRNKVENKCKRFRAGSLDFVLKTYYYNS